MRRAWRVRLTNALGSTAFAERPGVRAVEPTRWDDIALAGLLLLIGVPRVIVAAFADRPLGVEGTLSIACVVLALLVLVARRRR